MQFSDDCILMRQPITIQMNNEQKSIPVWDVPIRLFHWSLALGFISAYITAEFHFGFLHTLVGYFLSVLVLARIIWGFVGNQYARFNSFTFTAHETFAYLRSMFHGTPRHYLGHNPAGALMVFTMLVLLILILVTGLTTLAVIDFEGPLLFLTRYFNDPASYAMHHLHGWLIDIAIVLILLHIIGVVAGSMQHKENLVKAMLTGFKKSHPPTSRNFK